jgi:hypothetical protein
MMMTGSLPKIHDSKDNLVPRYPKNWIQSHMDPVADLTLGLGKHGAGSFRTESAISFSIFPISTLVSAHVIQSADGRLLTPHRYNLVHLTINALRVTNAKSSDRRDTCTSNDTLTICQSDVLVRLTQPFLLEVPCLWPCSRSSKHICTHNNRSDRTLLQVYPTTKTRYHGYRHCYSAARCDGFRRLSQ